MCACQSRWAFERICSPRFEMRTANLVQVAGRSSSRRWREPPILGSSYPNGVRWRLTNWGWGETCTMCSTQPACQDCAHPRQRAAYTLTARQRSKNKGNIAVFLCVDTLNGEGRDLCLTGERVPHVLHKKQHRTGMTKNIQLFQSRVAKFLVSQCPGDGSCDGVPGVAISHAAQETFCLHPNNVIKRPASTTTGGAPPSGAPTIGTVCVCGWVGGRRCKRVFSRSSGEETRIIFNPHHSRDEFNKCS
jgi:hypothetical protein